MLFCLMNAVLVSTFAVPATLNADITDPPLPRITTSDGMFVVADTGEPFIPRGFQYVRIRNNGAHYVHTPGFYQPLAVEEMFADLAEHGFNIVRTFLGLDGLFDETGISEAFLDNLEDFLRRARRHGIYVILERRYVLPVGAYGRALADWESHFTQGIVPGPNNMRYMSKAYSKAMALFWSDLVQAIKTRDPDLLSTVFAYELENESEFRVNESPIVDTSGTFYAPDGKAFDVSDEDTLQALLDHCTILWANAAVAAIQKVDPSAMVSASVFTYRASGRPDGPGKPRSATASDPRYPLRPVALAQSDLSYVDIHLYPESIDALDVHLENIEFARLQEICNKTGKPIFVGEFGALKPFFPDFTPAYEMVKNVIPRLFEQGFAGYCYWTYDCHEQPYVWNAKAEAGQIFQFLADFNHGDIAVNNSRGGVSSFWACSHERFKVHDGTAGQRHNRAILRHSKMCRSSDCTECLFNMSGNRIHRHNTLQ